MGINIITANFTNGGRDSITRKLYQYDYGQKVSLRGLSLPNIFEVHISNQNDINTAEVYTGRKNEIDIPDKFLLSGQNIYMWLFLHAAAADGQTRYTIMIPVEERPKPQPAVPTVDNNVINDLLIDALQNGLDGQPRNSAGINVTTAKFNGERDSITRKLYQYDYGQIISIKGLNLPKVFEVHISNSNKASTAEIYIGKDNEIEIPDKFLLSGEDIYLWIFLHSTAEDGETRYTITVPVKKKPKPEGQEPTVVERNTIDELIAALEINLNEMRQATEDAKNAMDEATAAAKEQMQLAIDKANDVVSKYPKIIEDYWYIYDVENQVWVNTQIKALAVDGVGIENIVYNNDYTITINLTDGTSYTTESIRGQKGDKGDTGATPNIKIQSTETLAPNQYANVTIEGTPEEPRLTFRIPKGEKGDKGDTGAMPQISIGTVETLLPHRSGYVTQTGTAENPVLNFGLVKGETGEQGIQGIQGETGPKGDKGDTGERGQTGKNAYEYATDGGYTGSENDFSERLAHIKTPQEIDQSITNAINNSGHYIKPTTGIPKSDLDINVQTSLGKADTAVQDLTEIQTSIQELTTRLNTLFDSDDVTLDQLSEIVVYIKNNKSLIDNITTGKISVTDIVDNLTSNVANKPLSAKQGKVLKDLIDAIVIPTKVSDLTDDSGHYTKPSGGIPASDLADGVVPVEDVQMNGTSILNDGVANVPVASGNNFGVVKINTAGDFHFGIGINQSGQLYMRPSGISAIQLGNESYKPITPYTQHLSTFYGLAKAAGDTTQSSSNNAVGNYTDSAKTAIKNMLGVPEDPLAVGTALPASADLNSYTTPGNYTADSTVIASITHAPTTTVEYKLMVEQISNEVIKQTVTTTETPANVYQRTGDSSSTDWVFGDWVKEIKSTDYATQTTSGVIKVAGNGLVVQNELLKIQRATDEEVKRGDNGYKPITSITQDAATFYGLSKAAGVDMKNSANAVGTYTDEAKSAIQDMLDVPSNSTLDDYVKNTDYATQATGGVVKIIDNGSGGFKIDQGYLLINPAYSNDVKSGNSQTLQPLIPGLQDASTFYGLAKAAGDTTQSASDNVVGDYTAEAKEAIQEMLDVPSTADKADVITATATGSLVTIIDGADNMPVKSLKVSFGPIQDGSGDPSPENVRAISGRTGLNVIRCGKNLLPNVGNNETKGGITATYNNDGSITLNGTAEASVLFEVYGTYQNHKPFYIKNASVVASGCPVGGGSKAYRFGIFAYKNNALVTSINEYGSGRTATIEECDSLFSTAQVYPGNTVTNLTFYPQLEFGSTASDYEPYKGSTYSVNWESEVGTVYGGTLDVVSGKLVVLGVKDTLTVVNGQLKSQFFYESTGQTVTVLGDNVRIALNRVSQTSNMIKQSSSYTVRMANLCPHYFAYASDTAHWYINNQLYLYLPKVDVGETLESYKTFLQDNPFEVYIQFATPTEIQLSQNEIRTLLGTNNFWSDGDNIELEYPADTKSYVDKSTIDDVQVDGTSVVSNGVANIPIATNTTPGVVIADANYGVYMASNNPKKLGVYFGSQSAIKAGTNTSASIPVARQHESTFYGLAKAAGADMKNSSNAVGTYTDEAKTAINKMIGSYGLNSGEAIPTNADLNTYTTPGTYSADSTVIASITNAPTTTDTYKLVVETVSETVIEQIVTAANGKVYRRTGDSSSTSWTFSSWIKDINSTDVASTSTVGVVKIGDGFSNPGDGTINVDFANADQIKAGSTQRKSITPYQQHRAVFYGLAKAAGVDMSLSSNALGTYTNDAKAAIQDMLDVPSNSDHASRSQHGLVKLSSAFQLNSYDEIVMSSPTSSLIKSGTSPYVGLTPQIQHESVFYGLAKAAGDTTQSASDNAVGTYTDNAKTAIRTMLGAVGDVQVNGTSVTSNGVANIPMADGTNPGVVKFDPSGGIRLNASGQIDVNRTTSAYSIKQGAHGYLFVPVISQHISTFYGLAKAAGEDMASSSNAVGTYTDAAKSAIKTMLGVPTDTYDLNLGEAIPTSTDLNIYTSSGVYNADSTVVSTLVNSPTAYTSYKLIVDSTSNKSVVQNAILADGSHFIRVGDSSNGTWKFNNWNKYIKRDDYATSNAGGVVKITAGAGGGINLNASNQLVILKATSAQAKAGTDSYHPITPNNQHEAAFYGLAKAAGDTTQSESDNTVGTYTDDAKTAIRSMLGTVGDVQVNGTSIVSNGVAEIPIVPPNGTTYGLVRPFSSLGTAITSSGYLAVAKASNNAVKVGANENQPIVPINQHIATFYGLAKAAGADMASSNNAVGTYTQEAKTAIQAMLGVTVPEAVGSCVEYITDSSVTIVGEPNTRYVCGEVTSIDITPPAVGTIDVTFTSGSTIAILTLPSTVKMPEWWGGVETGYTYELVITDGVYAGVMAWPQ